MSNQSFINASADDEKYQIMGKLLSIAVTMLLGTALAIACWAGLS